ncbi:MAG: hypothetical protein KatS3mg102_0888 [Planctomycetota bacterium]|nr:MAG: hypothetical protein KatS3mg102_0888 [Planctomycetota bacterium]
MAARGAARTFPVEVEVLDPDPRLRPGMFAWVELRAGEPTPRVVVPLEAVLARPDGRRVLFVLEADGRTVAERTIVPGRVLQSELEVVRGLERGEPVVVAGQTELFDGDRVEVLAAAEPAAGATAGTER